MTSITTRSLVLALFATSASAQSFNLDLGMNLILWPAPSAAYGAAAGQSGHWNEVVPPYAQNLADLTGNLTSVQVGVTGGPGAYNDPFSGLTGDDEAFMADQLWVPSLGVVVGVEFSGLEDGSYDVYTYGWDASGFPTIIDVPAGSGGPQSVGGTWSGSPHVLGVTYSLHQVQVVGGTLRVEATGGTFNDAGGLNGVQLVKTGGSPWTNYCTSTTNSTGSPATMDATGSVSIQANAFTLLAGPAPQQPGLFYYGPNQVQLAFGNGFRCVGGTVVRLPVQSPAGGQFQYTLDFANPPGGSTPITPGSTWNFQCWFRDPAGGGAFFDLSDGLEVSFLP